MSNLLPKYNSMIGPAVSDFPVQLSTETVPTLPVPSVPDETDAREDLSVFFGIGMTVNIVMIIAFVVWGVKQWKKNDTTKE